MLQILIGIIIALLALAAVVVAVVYWVREQRNPETDDISGADGSGTELDSFDQSAVSLLRYSIVPFIISGERLRFWPKYLFYNAYSYLREILAALAGIGLFPPVWKFLNTIPNPAPNAPSTPPSIPALTASGVAIAVALVLTRVYVSHHELDKKAVLASSCTSELRGLNVKLQFNATKGSASFYSELQNIANSIATIIQRHVTEGSWPYTSNDMIASGIEGEVMKRTTTLLRKLPPTTILEVSIQQKEK